MGWLHQESAYERRVRELDEEAERIRKNMQNLMKNTVREPSGRTAAPTGLRKRSSVMPGQSYAPVEEQNASDLETNAADEAPEFTASETRSQNADRSMGYGGIASSSGKPERLANYLASGSFGKGGSLSRERRIQRNKAIFMAVVAVIAVFSLYTWFN